MNAIETNRTVVFVDADNTLWDTDGVYAHAQLQLLKSVESVSGHFSSNANKLVYVRRIDQAIAARHHLGLRYPFRLLAQAIALVLAGETPEAAARAVWKGTSTDFLPKDELDGIETQFAADLRARPSLLPGVRAGLIRLHGSGALILVLSEGSRPRIIQTATEHGLLSYIDRVIESPKIPRLFERVLRLTGSPEQAFMIGDQLRSDIAPAKAASLITIYVPGRFKPRWEPDEELIGPSYRAETFDQAVDIVLHAGWISIPRK